LKKYKESWLFQKQVTWVALVPHHPIYYIDFTDLKKIIERDDNWRDAFQALFSRKDIIISTLSEIEIIRNSLAHNRRLAKADLELVRAAYKKLAAAIGESRIRSIVRTGVSLKSLQEQIELLGEELRSALRACEKCLPIRIPQLSQVNDQWWFDETYLGHDLKDLIAAFELLEKYETLPRGRGQGHIIESWLKSNRVPQVLESCIQTINILLESCDGVRGA
jgi:hypothetical protein